MYKVSTDVVSLNSLSDMISQPVRVAKEAGIASKRMEAANPEEAKNSKGGKGLHLARAKGAGQKDLAGKPGILMVLSRCSSGTIDTKDDLDNTLLDGIEL